MDFKAKQKFKLSPKKEKVGILLDYARELYKKGNKPTKRGIRNDFNVEIYNYFKNMEDYHKQAGIEVSLRHYPKEKARSIIINYVKKKARDNCYPSCRELEKKFKIHLSTYFKSLQELYKVANINFSLAERSIKERILKSHTYEEDIIEKQKESIRTFIRKNVNNGLYPSTRDIQYKLKLAFYNLYDSIYDAYRDSNVKYERPSPILLGKKKEMLFTKIIKELLIKMNFEIERVSIESKENFNKSADITIRDSMGNKYLVELKAYRKDYSMTIREFNQLLRYLKEEGISNGIFITTSNTKRGSLKNIRYINGGELITLLKKYNLSHFLGDIEWIRKSRINSKERAEYRERMKKKIFEYIQNKKDFPTKREIQENLNLDIRTVFGESNPFEKLKKEFELGTFLP